MDKPGLYRNVFYTVDEVATILGVSVRTVYRMMQDGEGSLQKVRMTGRALRVYGADLARFLGLSVEEVPVRERE